MILGSRLMLTLLGAFSLQRLFGAHLFFSEEMITDANFAAIAEAAVLKDLEGVKKAPLERGERPRQKERLLRCCEVFVSW